MSKITVLTFVAYYLPGYKSGGPVRTIANLVDRLGDEIDFCIVTRHRDALDKRPYVGVEIDAWNTVGKARVFYASPHSLSFFSIVSLMRNTPHDILYLNSFFNLRFTGFPLVARKLGLAPRKRVVIAPRGEFSEGALGLKSRKKAIYLRVAQSLQLYKGITWHASTRWEVEAIRRKFPPARHARMEIARNLAPLVDGDWAEVKHLKENKSDGELRICFLSRISPKKNLDFALRALKKVDVPVRFTIYGPKEEASYWDRCMALANALPENVAVEFAGAVSPGEVQQCLLGHDVFLFPTRGENYGHVIFEALSAGLFVIISDQTPWQDLEKEGVGIILPLNDVQPYADVLRAAADWSGEHWARIRSLATCYAQQIADDRTAVEANRKLFLTQDVA